MYRSGILKDASFRHMELNPRFDVMTIKCNSLRLTKNRHGLLYHPSLCLSAETVRFSLKITAELFASDGLVRQKGGFSVSMMISSRQFTCSICVREMTLSPFFGAMTSLVLSLRAWIFDASKISSSSLSATNNNAYLVHILVPRLCIGNCFEMWMIQRN